jgi:serine/threonine protein kinase
MLPAIALDEQAQNGFLREIANIRALQHPNIVRYRDAGAAEGTLFLVMEFCGGGNVDQLMKRRGGVLVADDAVPIVLQALEGLAHAHEAILPDVRLADERVVEARGLVHRDIKPHNILLVASESHSAKIGDFGLAKAFDTAG